jgi:adenylate cyclase
VRQQSGPVRLVLVAFIAAALLTAGLGFISLRTKALQSFDYWTADWRSALLADRAPSQHPGVAIVLIDDDAIEGLPYRSPIDRGLMARLIDRVSEARPVAIGLDFLFDQATEPTKDRELVAAIGRARGRIVIGSVDDRVPLSEARRAYLKSFIENSGAKSGFVNLRYEVDQVVRAEADRPGERGRADSFAAVIAAAGGAAAEVPAGRIAWLGTPADGSDTFLVVPAGTLLADKTEPERRLAGLMRAQLAGRVVLIGGDLSGQSDRHATPLSKVHSEPMPGVLIHAHLVAQYLEGRRFHPIAPLAELASVFAISLAGFFIGWRFFQTGIVVGVVPMLALAVLDAALFAGLRLTIPFASLAIAWLIAAFSARTARWWRERTFRNRLQGAI